MGDAAIRRRTILSKSPTLGPTPLTEFVIPHVGQSFESMNPHARTRKKIGTAAAAAPLQAAPHAVADVMARLAQPVVALTSLSCSVIWASGWSGVLRLAVSVVGRDTAARIVSLRLRLPGSFISSKSTASARDAPADSKDTTNRDLGSFTGTGLWQRHTGSGAHCGRHGPARWRRVPDGHGASAPSHWHWQAGSSRA